MPLRLRTLFGLHCGMGRLYPWQHEAQAWPRAGVGLGSRAGGWVKGSQWVSKGVAGMGQQGWEAGVLGP